MHPRRELEEHVPELAGFSQRPDGGSKQHERRIDSLRGEDRRLHLATWRDPWGRGQERAHLGGQGLEPGAVAGHGSEGLDVEDEARRRALHPARDVADVGDGVVGGC